MELKNVRRGRVREYADRFKGAVYQAIDQASDFNPLWMHRAHCAFPSATQNEINEKDAAHLVGNGISAVAEGANMPCTIAATKVLIDGGVLYAPGKAANAGGVATSGLEMAQNSARIAWPRERVDSELHRIMKAIHASCRETADQYGVAGNYVHGANIAGFTKVADAMLDQGLV
jgi:glutamate dehydrogenase (NADP+)